MAGAPGTSKERSCNVLGNDPTWTYRSHHRRGYPGVADEIVLSCGRAIGRARACMIRGRALPWNRGPDKKPRSQREIHREVFQVKAGIEVVPIPTLVQHAESQWIVLLIAAAVAVGVLLRLYMVLGRRGGAEPQSAAPAWAQARNLAAAERHTRAERPRALRNSAGRQAL